MISHLFYLTVASYSLYQNYSSLFLGGSPLNPGQLTDCIDRAFSRSKEVVRLINETLNSVDR